MKFLGKPHLIIMWAILFAGAIWMEVQLIKIYFAIQNKQEPFPCTYISGQCTISLSKKQEPENLQKEWKTVYFLLGRKKQPPETEHSVPEIIENHWKIKQIASTGPAQEMVLLQHPPAGHKRTDKDSLVKPMENQHPPRARRVCPRVLRCSACTRT